MAARRAGDEGPAGVRSAVPALAGLDGTYVQRMDLSPMVGVMMMLLIFVLTVTPAMTGGPYLPSAETTRLIPTGPATVWVDPQGRFYAGQPLREVSASALRQVLGNLLPSRPEDGVVYVIADRSTPYARLLDVMDAARAAHVGRPGLVTILPHRPGRAAKP